MRVPNWMQVSSFCALDLGPRSLLTIALVCSRAGSAEGSARGEPLDVLPGDSRDAVVVLVVVQHWDAGGFGCRGDEQVWMADCAVVQATLAGE